MSQVLGLFTNDIPPFPLSSTDTLTCIFILENNQGLTTQRHTIVEASLPGSELQRVLEETENRGESVVVQNDTGEWQFQLLEKTWVLRYVMLYVPYSDLKELIKDI